jgi:hypothetical protein
MIDGIIVPALSFPFSIVALISTRSGGHVADTLPPRATARGAAGILPWERNQNSPLIRVSRHRGRRQNRIRLSRGRRCLLAGGPRWAPADAVFYIQKGKVKVAVTSEQGKEAVVAILDAGANRKHKGLCGGSRRAPGVGARHPNLCGDEPFHSPTGSEFLRRRVRLRTWSVSSTQQRPRLWP